MAGGSLSAPDIIDAQFAQLDSWSPKARVKMIAAIGDEKVSGSAREAPVTDAEVDEKSAMVQQTIEWLRGASTSNKIQAFCLHQSIAGGARTNPREAMSPEAQVHKDFSSGRRGALPLEHPQR